MRVLAIDTATQTGFVVASKDDAVCASTHWRSRSQHGENLIDRIERVLDDAGWARHDVDLIGVSIGPGGFTSVRVGLATAKGLALALKKPIVGVLSLRVHARALATGDEHIRVPILDAYRGEVFTGAYEWRDGALAELVSPVHGPPESVLAEIERTIGDRQHVRGEAKAALHPAALATEVCDQFCREGAADLATLQPTYLRPSDAKSPTSRPPAE